MIDSGLNFCKFFRKILVQFDPQILANSEGDVVEV
jgi:hypothetical protein